MTHTITTSATLILLLSLFSLFNINLINAHEHRLVPATTQKYLFIVGFEQEPAFATFLNAASLAVTVNNTGLPVSGLQDKLSLAVSIPGDSTPPLTVSWTTVYNTPQNYNGWFVPTKGGAYTFHITGSIYDSTDGSSTAIDEVFTSGNGFDVVQSVDSLYYPSKPTSATSSAPTTVNCVSVAAATVVSVAAYILV